MTLRVKAISDIKEFLEIGASWDAFVNMHCDNPFVLSKFLSMYLELNRSQGWAPMFLIVYAKDEIAGIAPLMIKERFGIRTASFVLKPYSTPDFVIADQFRTECVDSILDVLFRNLHCKFADLAFPAESGNLSCLEDQCKSKGIHFDTESYIGRRMLSVEGNWEQFETQRGGNFRRRFRKMEQRLNEVGSVGIRCVKGEQDQHDAFDKALAVDRASWKEAWRASKMVTTDPDLSVTWNGAGQAAKTNPHLKHTLWFLELNDHPIAYAMIVKYKQTTYIVKTSYDVHYKSFYPGMFIINAALRSILDNEDVRYVDFLTDMSFMEAWTTLVKSRVRVFVCKGVLPTRMISLYKSARARQIAVTMLNQLPRRIGRAFELK